MRGFPPLCRFSRLRYLDGAASRLRELGDVRDALGALGVDHGVPVVLCVLVSWLKEE